MTKSNTFDEKKPKMVYLTSTPNHFSRTIFFKKCRVHPEFNANCHDCQNTSILKCFTDIYGRKLNPDLKTGKKAFREITYFLNQKIEVPLIYRTPKKNDPMVGVFYGAGGVAKRLNDTVYSRIILRVIGRFNNKKVLFSVRPRNTDYFGLNHLCISDYKYTAALILAGKFIKNNCRR